MQWVNPHVKRLPFDYPMPSARAIAVAVATKGSSTIISLLVAALVLLLAPAPSIPTAEAEPVDDPAWLLVRSRLPPAVVVLRPTWLPAEFQSAPMVQYADETKDEGPIYLVGYRAPQSTLHFALGPVNSAPPDRIEHLNVRGVMGFLQVTRGWPSIGAYWQEEGRHYSVAATGLDRAEIERIVARLRPVPSTSTGAAASQTATGLPRGGGVPFAYPQMLALSILIAGAGWLMRGHGARP